MVTIRLISELKKNWIFFSCKKSINLLLYINYKIFYQFSYIECYRGHATAYIFTTSFFQTILFAVHFYWKCYQNLPWRLFFKNSDNQSIDPCCGGKSKYEAIPGVIRKILECLISLFIMGGEEFYLHSIVHKYICFQTRKLLTKLSKHFP